MTKERGCQRTNEFSFRTLGATLCPTSGCHSGSLAFILIHNVSSLCTDVCEAQTPRILRHATLPFGFPLRISRGMIGCNPLYLTICVDTLTYCLLKAELLATPRTATTPLFLWAHLICINFYELPAGMLLNIFCVVIHLRGVGVQLFFLVRADPRIARHSAGRQREIGILRGDGESP